MLLLFFAKQRVKYLTPDIINMFFEIKTLDYRVSTTSTDPYIRIIYIGPRS
jgi:hypothetical protein